jgi:hypothetical protein
MERKEKVMRTGLIAGTLACVVAATVFNFSPRRTRRSPRKEAKMRLAIIMLGIIAIACVTHGAVQLPSGYEAKVLGQNFGGGFDYLPNGDIIGMYVDTTGAIKSYIGMIDANGDGIPAGVEKKYDFGSVVWGAFVKVSPAGTMALFGESTNYKVYLLDLRDYAVSEIVPQGGSFDGAFDCAFIDDSHCYLSANPAWGTVNKILHLNLATGAITEIASIDGTYSGPIDVDGEGNLYYVKGKANYPVKPGDFTILRFNASDLAAVLGGAPVIGMPDAAVVAGGLDGGYDVAWHSSGAIYVSDANNGKVYKVNPDSTVSILASLPGNSGEGFTVISIYRRDQAFGPNTSTKAEVAVGYLPLPGASSPDVYRITSLPLPVHAMVNTTLLGAGDRFVLSIAVQPTTQPFDAYVVFRGPGVLYSLTTRGLVKGVKAYALGVPALRQAVTKDLLDMPIPVGVPAGTWTIYAGLMPKGTAPSPTKAFALDSIEVTME